MPTAAMPTPEPSPLPTARPTPLPLPAPTRAPSPAPSPSPTPNPTRTPLVVVQVNIDGIDCAGFNSSVFVAALDYLIPNATFAAPACADASDGVAVETTVAVPLAMALGTPFYGTIQNFTHQQLTRSLRSGCAPRCFTPALVGFATGNFSFMSVGGRRLDMSAASVSGVSVATFAPSPAPTPAPTAPPSPAPSPPPSALPTPSPSPAPTPSPSTPAPTLAPTTAAPTAAELPITPAPVAAVGAGSSKSKNGAGMGYLIAVAALVVVGFGIAVRYCLRKARSKVELSATPPPDERGADDGPPCGEPPELTTPEDDAERGQAPDGDGDGGGAGAVGGDDDAGAVGGDGEGAVGDDEYDTEMESDDQGAGVVDSPGEFAPQPDAELEQGAELPPELAPHRATLARAGIELEALLDHAEDGALLASELERAGITSSGARLGIIKSVRSERRRREAAEPVEEGKVAPPAEPGAGAGGDARVDEMLREMSAGFARGGAAVAERLDFDGLSPEAGRAETAAPEDFDFDEEPSSGWRMKAEFVSPGEEPEAESIAASQIELATTGSALGSSDAGVPPPSPVRRRIDLLHAEILDNDSEDEA